MTPVTLPRLELCGALLAETLLRANLPILQEHYVNAKVHCWTDSTIVLHWLSMPPQELQTFVANREVKIRELDSIVTWHHVRSADNPADLCSCGVAPAELVDNKFWFHEPNWLSLPESEWPKFSPLPTPNVADLELRKCIALELVNIAEHEDELQSLLPEEEDELCFKCALAVISPAPADASCNAEALNAVKEGS